LVGALAGYTISIYANTAMLEAMSDGKYDLDVITPSYGKYIEPVNIAVMAMVLLGFVAFGAFALGNLNGNKEEGEEEGVEVQTPSQTQGRGDKREQRPVRPTGVPATEEEELQRGQAMKPGRDDLTKGLTLPVRPPRYPNSDSTTPSSPTGTTQGGSQPVEQPATQPGQSPATPQTDSGSS
jgi:hypothetical protein